MATRLSDGWEAFQSGRFREAKQSFQAALETDSNSAQGYLGLAAANLASGNLRDALSHGNRSLEENPTPQAHLLTAEAHSRLGNREEAIDHLDDYFELGGETPFARALLGEQYIRTARWDEGLEAYLTALSGDRDGQAYRQLQRVLKDLVDAVHDGPLPSKPAEEFVNRLEYNLASPPRGAQNFFASVRRALQGGQRIQEPGGSAPIFRHLEEFDSSSRPPTPPPPEARSSSPPRSSEPSSEAPSDRGSESPKGIDAKQKDLAGVIQRDRQKNEQLQESVGTMGPPNWPSSAEQKDIDPIPILAWDDQSIYADEPGMDSTTFRITTGSVRAEIFLERCLQNLLAGAKQDRAASIRFRPEAITRIEVNCWDGLLDRLPPLSPIYDEFHEAEKYEQLALGRFLGECVAVAYDGTWDFVEPPEDSKLVVGNQTLDPLTVAAHWVNAADHDDVDLNALADRAAEASRESTSMTVEQNYIDPTTELQGTSLNVKLAELWTGYLFRPTAASFAEIAKTVSTHEVSDSVILFSIDPKFCPPIAKGPSGAAVREDGTVGLAYLRGSGEMLLLGSRKHAARALGTSFDTLDRENASEVVTFLAEYFRPNWVWVHDRKIASDLSRSTDHDLDAPRLQSSDGETILHISAIGKGQIHNRVSLTVPSGDGRWTIEVERN